MAQLRLLLLGLGHRVAIQWLHIHGSAVSGDHGAVFRAPEPCLRGVCGLVDRRSRPPGSLWRPALLRESARGSLARTRHDTIKWAIDSLVVAMGGRCVTEVYGLFAPLLSQEAREVTEGQWSERERQGMVPDFLIECGHDKQLAELKTLSLSHTWYGKDTTTRCSAVAARAQRIPGEYRGKADNLDRQFNGTTEGAVGPVQARLGEFGTAIGALVFGMHGEASPDVHQLARRLAELGGSRFHREMLAASPAHAKGILAFHIRRHLGGAALRASADLILNRLSAVGGGAAAAHARRDRARRAFWGARYGPADAQYSHSRASVSHTGFMPGA